MIRRVPSGFDTASSIALLAVSALAKEGADGRGISNASIVILPVIIFIGINFPTYTNEMRPPLVPLHSWHDARRLSGLHSDAVLVRRLPRTILQVI